MLHNIMTYDDTYVYIYIYILCMYGWNELTPITKVIQLYSMSYETSPYKMAVGWGSNSMGQVPRMF